MTRTTTARRSASALGAASLLALLLAAPAAARQDPGTGGRDFDVVTSRSQPQSQSVAPVTNDDAIQYLQVGAGVIVGIALAGAGAAMASRRRHQDLTVA